MKQREIIGKLAKEFGDTFLVSDASSLFGLSNTDVAKKLSRWEKLGWVKRIRRGLYSTVPLDSGSPDEPLENMWAVVPDLFSPGYVGGWSAAEYWDFTEQIFTDICVLTEKKVFPQKQEVLGISFFIFHMPSKLDFGLETVWIKNKRVDVSDPNKTILDMLYKPRIGGGIQHAIDCFKSYIKGGTFDPLKLVAYTKKMNNGVIFKRLGYLSEKILGMDHDLTQICLKEITKGPSYIDPSDKSGKFLRRWNLYVPTTLQF
jgi:predicted transcriptional regulator of viral defense system